MQTGHATLQQFPLIKSAGLDGLKAGVDRLFGNCAVDAPRATRSAKFTSTMNYRALDHLGLLYGNYGAPFDASIGPYESYVLGFLQSGSGEHQFANKPAMTTVTRGAIIQPGDSVKLHYPSAFDHFVLVVKPASLHSKLEALIGSPPVAPLRFTAAVNYEHPDAHALRRLVMFLAEESSGNSPATSPLVLAELQQAIMVSFLCCTESNSSPMLKGEARSSAPWQVRRAEEYIAANWDQPITVEALTLATNVSARSLFYSFKKARGYSPMVLVKQIRLNRAKEMLSKPGLGTSVTEVAYTCGFGNLGHFANDYCQRFGERPSDTLRLSKS